MKVGRRKTVRYRQKKIKRLTVRNQRGGLAKDITLAVLTWNSPTTLKGTLDSYKKHGLLEMVHSMVYFQERKPEDDELAKKYGIDEVLGTSENVGVLNAFVEIMKHVKTKYFILAEDDFLLIHGKDKTRRIIDDCMKLFEEKDVKYIRLRDRKNPGSPLYSRDEIGVPDEELTKYDYSDYTHKAEVVHFLDHPDHVIKHVFTPFHPPEFNYTWYTCDFKDYHWSANIYIAETKFLTDVVVPILAEHKRNMNNDWNKYHGIEPLMWKHIDKLYGYRLATGEGLFKHERVDISPRLANIKGVKATIPHCIYMTWHSKDIPSRMKKSIEKLKKMNPEFDLQIYDGRRCRKFIKDNFDASVLKAYDTLIPLAFKSDLWRYCVLYKLGGVYIDSKYYSLIPLSNILNAEGEVFVKDVDATSNSCDSKFAIWNGFIIAKEGNEILKKAIDEVVKNCKNKTIPNHPMNISGPCMLGSLFNQNPEFKSLVKCDLVHDATPDDSAKAKLVYKGQDILKQYEGYRGDQKNAKTLHWLEHWKRNEVYH